jgi:2Fe-2S ferredoxin
VVCISSCKPCHAGAEEEEEDLLGMAWGLSRNSRLSCQIIIPEHDITISIPKYTINHARE